ncbi:MAG: SDR family oxidoreductase [Candidatus Omnitrophica bacterium]|nr:SDR family oxidoreductase [Candidatus Omnitrophota bacterium]
MNIAITGATGLLGKNFLFEAIKQNLGHLDALKIYVLGKGSGDKTIYQRIRELIFDDGMEYINANAHEKNSIRSFCEHGLIGINMDLGDSALSIGNLDLTILKSVKFDGFFHFAALTDLRNSQKIFDLLKLYNVEGTKKILDLLSSLNVKEFSYVGTAYACGESAGVVKPDYVNFDQPFRNSYERTKIEAETIVRNFAKRSKIKFRFFRPSVTCGRLIEKPHGAMSKFDVFYGWAAFFLLMKTQHLTENDAVYETPITLNARVKYSLNSGLNIVPADYTAKLIYQVFIQNDAGESYHIVQERETPHTYYISEMLKAINVLGVRHIDEIPNDKNNLEKLYYKTAGQVFTPYINSAPIIFDTTNLGPILKNVGLVCPPVDEKTFPSLMSYAKEKKFGIDIKKVFQDRHSFTKKNQSEPLATKRD